MAGRRTGLRIALTAAAVGLCAAAPSAAAGGWRVSGAFSGPYDNTVGWEQCVTGATGTASEHVDLDVRLGPGNANYRRGEPQFGVVLKVDIAGRWGLSGSYAPRRRDADGNESCEPPASFACSGGMASVTGKPKAAMLFVRRGRVFAGQFLDFVGVREDEGPPESCPALAGDDSFAVVPLLGLTTGNATEDIVEGVFTVPASRLRGRRAFTVPVTPGSQNPSQCPDAYVSCTQTNRLTFTLRFTPRR